MPGSVLQPCCVSLLSCCSTYFGKEAEVAAHTHLDSHRVEKPCNHWVLVTGAPRKGSPTMLDLRRPAAESACAPQLGADPGAQ